MTDLPTKSLLDFAESERRVAEGASVLARGVGSDFRIGISPTPLVIERAFGPYVVDADGNRLIDYYLGMGPMILGHNPAEVIDAVVAQLGDGILFAGQSDVEYEAARLVCRMVPCAERVRFNSSGSEAVQAALRIARAATGRTQVLKFEGHYHGWFDSVLCDVSTPVAQLGERTAPAIMPGSKGQDVAALSSMSVLPWNDADLAVDRIRRGDLAAVVMEPVMCNTSAILPRPGYLEAVRASCRETGTVLIFDEVITGFRVAPGGAQERLGVTPDLAVFGKAIANGFPVSCVAGRADLMELTGGGDRALHGGTYNGQAAGMAAVVATLRRLESGEVHATLERRGEALRSGLKERLSAHGIAATVQGFPQIFHVALGVDQPIVDYRSAAAADRATYVRITTELLRRGVRALERGAWFLSAAHEDAVIATTLDTFDAALTAAVQ